MLLVFRNHGQSDLNIDDYTVMEGMKRDFDLAIKSVAHVAMRGFWTLDGAVYPGLF